MIMHARQLISVLAGVVMASGLLAANADEAAATETGDDVALLFILDVSRSMVDDDLPGGVRRIDAAREAVHSVVAGLPDGMPTGLRAYGHRYDTSDKARSCDDTELVVPIRALDRAALTDAVDELEPMGYTPIGASLEQAADDFGEAEHRTIVLVSDGLDTCAPPDPCDVADSLIDQGIEVTIQTVGFAIDDEAGAREQLSCIAEATGGEYRYAADADQLGEVMSELAIRAANRYQSAAEQVEGAPIYRDAPLLEPGVPYTDTMVANEAKWYAIDLDEGETFWVEGIHPGGSSTRNCASFSVHEVNAQYIWHPDSHLCSGETTSVEYVYANGARESRWRAGATGTRYVDFTATRNFSSNAELVYEFIIHVDPPRDAGPTPEATAEPTDVPATAPTTAPAGPAGDPTPVVGSGADSGGPADLQPLLLAVIGLLALLVIIATGVIVVLLRRRPQG